MAVTDLTYSLPWWARGGAGPTGGPAATPMGGSDPTPPAGVSMQDWLNWLQQWTGHGDGDNPPATPQPVPPAPPIAASVQQPPAASPGPPVGAGMLDQSGVARMGGPNGVLNTQPPTGASAPVGASLLDQSGVTRNPTGVLTPGAPATPAGTSPASPVAAPAARVPGPLASGGAAGSAATSNPRFIGLDYRPNASPQNSMRAGPQSTAFNLAGLFGQGQPAAAPAAPGARPQVAGPLAGGGMVPSTYPGDNWDIDAQGNVVPNYGSPGTTGPLQRPPKSSVARARILAPNYYG